jgi:hypothetical protein
MLQIGESVRFIHTGDHARIIQILDNGMYLVKLAQDGDEIPAFGEDIVPQHLFDPSFLKKKPVKEKKTSSQFGYLEQMFGYSDRELDKTISYKSDAKVDESIADEIVRTDESYDKTNLVKTDSGLSLCLQTDEDGQVAVILVNDTAFAFDFYVKYSLNGVLRDEFKLNIGAYDGFMLIGFDKSELAGKPTLELDISVFNFNRKVVFKPQHLNPDSIKKLMGKFEGCCLNLFKTPPASKPTESLQEIYEKAKYSGELEQAPSNSPFYVLHDIKKKAEFKNELDLHIEKLVPNTSKLDPTSIMTIQLSRFHEYIEEAILAGVPVVYIIHGLGQGKLKDEIHKALKENKAVKRFINQYHAKYGFGATEIQF